MERPLLRLDLLPFKYHLFAGMLVRVVLIVYASVHDDLYEIPYTDVDYKVFTDAARYVVNGESPYKRHTYRYSPIIAFMMTPNILIGRYFGKLIFSMFDILIAASIKVLVQQQLKGSKDVDKVSMICLYCALFWLYNPVSIGISTRGNADSMPCLFIILSVMFLQTDVMKSLWKYAISGILLGIAIHLRLYPLAFSLPMYLSLGEYNITRQTGIKDGLLRLMPNMKQLILAFSCMGTLFVTTYGLYAIYGYEFLFETYIYHLFRKDSRHNFSLLFYYSYLTMDQLTFDIVKTIAVVFECIILFVMSLAFGCQSQTLIFGMFCQAVVLVVFNSVLTSQYFIWYLSLLPLVVHNFKIIPVHAVMLSLVWATAQGAWLFYAYLLEFKSREVFILIWLKSVVFFCANIFVLCQLIKRYTPGYGFGLIRYDTSEAKSK